MTHDHLAALREAAIRLLNELDKHGYPRNCDAAVAHLRGVLMRQTGAPK